ncbi:MAG: transglutaminase domain-containing protein, partial [Armatimonadetes bacterium]|nr:transglutaminase domain-containing protein [Armatimonadota bacterium]
GEVLWASLPLGMAMYRMSEADARSETSAEPEHSEEGDVGTGEGREQGGESDFAAQTAIVPDRPIAAPRRVRRLVLEIGGLPDDLKPISDALQSARRSTAVSDAAGGGARYTFTITAAARGKSDVKLPIRNAALTRYVAPGPYLDMDRPEVRALARQLRDPSGRSGATASRIRKWVHQTLKPDYGIGVPRSATDIILRKRGVCRDYATLFAAIARAAGVPTRLVGGIVYADGRFYYHAWVECWSGRWVPYDATLPTDFVDATHVKFAQGDPTDMMQVFRVIGKLTARIVSVAP